MATQRNATRVALARWQVARRSQTNTLGLRETRFLSIDGRVQRTSTRLHDGKHTTKSSQQARILRLRIVLLRSRSASAERYAARVSWLLVAERRFIGGDDRPPRRYGNECLKRNWTYTLLGGGRFGGARRVGV